MFPPCSNATFCVGAHLQGSLLLSPAQPHPPPVSYPGNTIIGGNREKGVHALDDDKRLKRFIITVLISPSYEEGFLAGHVAGCMFDLLLALDKVAKWRL